MMRLLSLALSLAVLVGCSSKTAYHSVRPVDGAMEFELVVDDADFVSLHVSSDDFEERTAHRHGNVWHADVPSTEGTIKYFYRVNGELMVPPCKYLETDGFGGVTCLLVSLR